VVRSTILITSPLLLGSGDKIDELSRIHDLWADLGAKFIVGPTGGRGPPSPNKNFLDRVSEDEVQGNLLKVVGFNRLKHCGDPLHVWSSGDKLEAGSYRECLTVPLCGACTIPPCPSPSNPTPSRDLPISQFSDDTKQINLQETFFGGRFVSGSWAANFLNHELLQDCDDLGQDRGEATPFPQEIHRTGGSSSKKHGMSVSEPRVEVESAERSGTRRKVRYWYRHSHKTLSYKMLKYPYT